MSIFPTLVTAFKTEDGGNLFLDQIPGAYFALGLIKLRDAYSGSCIRVRRASDNAEQDIGFDGSGYLDQSALTTFCSGTNGFVTTWYGQDTTGRNWTQTTNGSQPQIVSGGSVLTLGSKPVINFTSSTSLTYQLTGSPTFNGWNGSDLTNFFVGQITGRTNVISSPTSTGYFYYDRSFTTMDFRHNSTTAQQPRPTSAQQYIFNFYYDNGTDLELWFDNSSQGALSMTGDWTVPDIEMGGDANNIGVQEFILYDSDKSADISTGNGILNAYYSVY